MPHLLLDNSGNIITDGTNCFSITWNVVASLTRGYVSGWDSGVTTGADMYVSTTGSDANPGTEASPKLTIQAAWNASSDGDTIAIRGGTYREAVTATSGNGDTGRTITRYGTEEYIISGRETLTGFTQCTSGDQADVGANYASIYKKTGISTSLLADSSNLLGMNIHEDGTWLPIATDRADTDATNDYFAKRVDSMHTASSNFTLDGSNNITGITDTVNLAGYTQTQIVGTGSETRASVVVWGNPNKGFYEDITAFNDSTDTLTLAGNVGAQGGSGANNKYSLVNALPSLKQGSWGYIDNGDNTFDLYIWPAGGGAPGTIEYSARTFGINISGTDNLTLKGAKIVGQGGTGNGESCPFGMVTSWASSTRSDGVTAENCYFGETDNGSESYGCRFWGSNSVEFKSCTFSTIINGHAYNISGTASASTTAVNIENCLFENITDTPCWHYDVRNVEFHKIHMNNCGKNAHANQFIFYDTGGGSDNVMVYAVKTRDMGGYVTWQGCTRINFGFCDFDSEDSDGFRRSINDQNNSASYTYTNTGSGNPCYIWNTFGQPKASDLGTPGGNQNGWTLIAAYDANLYWEIYNSIGHGLQSGNNAKLTHESNVWTGQAASQDAGDGWTTGTNETINTTATDNYVNPSGGDFSTPASGDDISGTTVYRCDTDFITGLQSRFTNVDFTTDIDDQAITWGTDEIGPYAAGMGTWVQ